VSPITCRSLRLCNRDRSDRSHRNGAAFQKGGALSAWVDMVPTERILHRRKAEANGNQQTTQSLPAKAIHLRSARRNAAKNETTLSDHFSLATRRWTIHSHRCGGDHAHQDSIPVAFRMTGVVFSGIWRELRARRPHRDKVEIASRLNLISPSRA
jgi:hypothetical protein